LNLAPNYRGDAVQKYSGGDAIDSLSYDRGGVPVGVQHSKVSQCSEHGNADTTAEVTVARIGPGTRGEDEVAGRTDGPHGCSEGTLAEGILAESGLELEVQQAQPDGAAEVAEMRALLALIRGEPAAVQKLIAGCGESQCPYVRRELLPGAPGVGDASCPEFLCSAAVGSCRVPPFGVEVVF